MSAPASAGSRLLLQNLIIGSIALLVSFGAGEAALRLVADLPMRRPLPEVRYMPHSVRRFTLVPGQQAFTYGAPARIDGRGFRVNGDDAPAATGTRSILALGDSFTFGLGVRDEETWPAQLESRLRQQTHSPVAVVNAGTISYGVFQEMDLLRSAGLATRPAVVLHALYWNDFMNAAAPDPRAPSAVDAHGYLVWDALEPRGGVRQAASTVVSSSALLFALRQAAANIRQTARQQSSYGAAYDRMLRNGLTEGEWKIIEDFYRDLQALGQSGRFEILVAIMPVVDIVTGENPDGHPYRREARRRLERLGIEYVDGFTGQSAVTFLPQGRDAHLNAAGYTAVAAAVAGKLVAQGTDGARETAPSTPDTARLRDRRQR